MLMFGKGEQHTIPMAALRNSHGTGVTRPVTGSLHDADADAVEIALFVAFRWLNHLD